MIDTINIVLFISNSHWKIWFRALFWFMGILECLMRTLYYLEAHWRSWSDLNFFFQTINTFIRLGAISRPRNLSSKLSSTKGNMGWNPLLSNKNSIRSSSSSNISSSNCVFSNSLKGQSWLWQGNNKTSGILLYIFPKFVQGEALEFSPLCNDWQTRQASAKSACALSRTLPCMHTQ